MPVIPALRKSRVQGQHPQHRELRPPWATREPVSKQSNNPPPKEVGPLSHLGLLLAVGASRGRGWEWACTEVKSPHPSPKVFEDSHCTSHSSNLPRQRKVKVAFEWAGQAP